MVQFLQRNDLFTREAAMSEKTYRSLSELCAILCARKQTHERGLKQLQAVFLFTI